MRRRTSQRFAIGILVLSELATITNRLQAQVQTQTPSFTAHIRNRAGVNSETLQGAEDAATKIFGKSGVGSPLG
jgi:hypothetical protein